jgi:hypothetical protein
MDSPPARGGNAQASVTNRGGDRPHTRHGHYGGADAGIHHECGARHGTLRILPCRPTLKRANPICGGDLPKDERQVADRVAQAQHAPRKFTSIGDKPLAINYSDCGDGPQSEYPLSSRL